MKIQKLLLYFLAAGALFVGCGPKEDPQPSTPMLNVSPSEVKFEQGGGSVSVSVTSNRPWSIETDADWLNFSPANGAASDAAVSINVSALANSGNDRTASFKVKTEFDFRTISVTQPGAKGEDTTDKPSGDGTKENPYNPAGVVAYINTLAADTESPNVVYVTGKISEVGTTYEASGNYGNATFYMSEDGSKSLTQFYVFQTYYLGNKKWKSGQTDVKVGDAVTVCGKVTNYKGNTPETVGKGASYVCTLNGKTEYGEGGQSGDQPEAKGKGTVDDPYNPSAAANAVANLTWTSNTEYQTTDVVYVKGKISRIADKGTYTGGGSFGNASFWIVEDGTDFEFQVYRALYLGNKKYESGQTDIKVGDEVIICGKLMNYKGNTPETDANNAYLYSLNGETAGGGGSSSDYEDAASKTVAEFISAADESTYFKLTGTVSNFKSQYCSFDLTDETGTIYVYSVANKDDWSSKVSNGGTVTLAGKYQYYEKNSQHEVVNAYILSFEGGAGGDTEEVKTATIAEFLAAEKSTTQPYKLTGTVSNIKSTVYGNFDLTDETGTVYIYGLVSKDLGGYDKNKANDKSFESIGIKEGDKITIVTFRDDFTKDDNVTIEGVGGYYVSGASGGSGGGDDTPAEDATVAQALAAEKDAVLNVGPALVVAAASTGILIEQDGSMIYVYGGTAAVGDMVTVKATRAEYSGTPQLSNPTVTVKSSDNKVTYPSTAKDINSTFDTYTSTSREFVTFKGKLSISNDKYFNITVGSSTVTGSLVKPVEDMSSYNDKDVTVKGYYLYHTSSKDGKKYLYVIATEINGTALTGKTSGGGSGGGGEVSGNVETVVFSSMNLENSKQYKTLNGTNVKFTFGDGSNDGKYYTTGTGIRVYNNGYIQISSEKTITKIVYTFDKATASDKSTYPTGTDYSVSTGSMALNGAVATWTGSAKTIKLTRPDLKGGHWRLQKVEVTFTE